MKQRAIFFKTLRDVAASPLAKQARAPRSGGKQDRLFRSTRLEDMIYQDLRQGDAEFDKLEKLCSEQLSTFPALCRDIFQSFYSLNLRKNPEEMLSESAMQFNKPILETMMQSEDYTAAKSSCGGRQLPAYTAAKEFAAQTAGQMEELIRQISGKRGPEELSKQLEKRRDDSLDALQDRLKQAETQPPDARREAQIVAAANQAQSQVNQAAAVARIRHDNAVKNKKAISMLVGRAANAAAEKAKDTASILLAWGAGNDPSSPQEVEADWALVERIRKNTVLLETARHLGRLKELIRGKRKNGYAYGRGETYSLELGGNVSRALGAEFALLAAPETVPLFLRKLQRRGLKQYQRREPLCKGRGDIICMLDESDSARKAAPWCKAVALALLDIAAAEKRRFAMIHFARRDNFHTDLFLPGAYTKEDMLRAAETFLGGGTDYVTPLKEALRLAEQEGFEKADMVFVTDGDCFVPEQFLSELKQEQARKKFQITGVLLDQDAAGFAFSLEPFCTQILRTSQLTQDQIAETLLDQRV